MKEIILVAGNNGSGKTTLATHLCQQKGYPFLNADEIARTMPAGSPSTNAIRAGRLFLQEMQQLIQEHRSFVVESTISGRMLANTLRACQGRYYIDLHYIFLSSSHICTQRIEERVKRGGHFVPTADVHRRYQRSKQQFRHNYRYICDEWTLINNDDAYVKVASGKKDLYEIHRPDMMDLFFNDDVLCEKLS